MAAILFHSHGVSILEKNVARKPQTEEVVFNLLVLTTNF